MDSSEQDDGVPPNAAFTDAFVPDRANGAGNSRPVEKVAAVMAPPPAGVTPTMVSTAADRLLPVAKRQCRDASAIVQRKEGEPSEDGKACEEEVSHTAIVELSPNAGRGTAHNLSGQNLCVDALMEIFARLQPDGILRVATASTSFRDIIRSPDFRQNYRANQKATMLGFFVKTKPRDPELFPYVTCDCLPAPLFRASESIRELWTAGDTRPNNYWRYVELLDSRDGKVLLRAGDSNRDPDLFVFYPHARRNRHRRIPQLRLFQGIWILTAALLPDDNTHQYNVIVLSRRRVPESKVTAITPPSEAIVACFSSSTGRWVKAKTVQSFPIPSKQMLRMGSVLINGTIYFLHSTQIITIDISSLELGTIGIPGIEGTKRTKSRMAHVLSRGPGSELWLAVATGRNICMYSYSKTSNSWEKKATWLAPGCIKGKAVKLMGSSESEGMILVKSEASDVISIEVETGLLKWIGSCESNEEVLVYEQVSSCFPDAIIPCTVDAKHVVRWS